MELSTVWFLLIAVLWTGYLVLEGFDFGVGSVRARVPLARRDALDGVAVHQLEPEDGKDGVQRGERDHRREHHPGADAGGHAPCREHPDAVDAARGGVGGDHPGLAPA